MDLKVDKKPFEGAQMDNFAEGRFIISSIQYEMMHTQKLAI